MFLLEIQCNICEEVHRSLFLEITADSTTDVSACEQVSCSLQLVGASLVSYNVFFGLYTVPDSKAHTLFVSHKDTFSRLNLPFPNQQGYCFDETSNMSGPLNDVQTKLKEACPNALYTHCSTTN